MCWLWDWETLFIYGMLSSNKVEKLCDLGVDDSVCSVGWAQRGTQLAVGTSNGEVQ
ncbi:cell cycle switch protein 52 A2, partial [Perilla frutescens var. hirtella]